MSDKNVFDLSEIKQKKKKRAEDLQQKFAEVQNKAIELAVANKRLGMAEATRFVATKSLKGAGVAVEDNQEAADAISATVEVVTGGPSYSDLLLEVDMASQRLQQAVDEMNKLLEG